MIGGSLAAGPLWLPFLIAAIQQKTTVTISEPSPWVGALIIAFGLIAVLVPEFIEQQAHRNGESQEYKEQRKHDAVYAKAIRDLITEEDFEWLLLIIGDTHTMRKNHRDMLKKLERELISDETGFIDEEMKLLADKLMRAVSELLSFSALNFFVPNNPNIRDEFWMFPAGNWDRGAPNPTQEKHYGDLRRELNKLLDNLELFRKEFLSGARNKLLLVND